ncbi:MAG: hypothetical protein L6R39_000372 [Caloplaca ligustica]|nr:MAG: hypothetical protein L6R39_000372 [Caloplaca ligustica]
MESEDRRSILSSRRHSRLPSSSTSSFFGSNNLETLYPTLFLEEPEAGTADKENDSQSRIPNESFRGTNVRPHSFYSLNEVLATSSQKPAEHSEIGEASTFTTSHMGESKETPSSTARTSRRVSTRLANATFFRLHTARHSLAAVPQSSPRPRDCESGVVIEERRLMAPIDPPLPRNASMNAAHNTSTVQANPYQYSPRTPNFMHPTSTSAARRTEPSKPFKRFTPPAPLNLPLRDRTDMVDFGFHRHRERKNAFDEYAQLKKTHNSPLSEDEPQLTSNDQPVVITSPGKLAIQPQQRYTTHCLIARAAYADADVVAKRYQASLARKGPNWTTTAEADPGPRTPPGSGLRHASTPDLRNSYITDVPPTPSVPQQFRAAPVEGVDERFRFPGRVRPAPRRPSLFFQRQASKQSLANEPGAPISRIPLSTSGMAAHQGPQAHERPFENLLQPSGSQYSLQLGRPSLGLSGSSKSLSVDKPLPALPTNGAARSAFPPRNDSLQGSQLSRSNFSSVQFDNDYSIESITPRRQRNLNNDSAERHDNTTATSPAPQPTVTAPANKDEEEVKEDKSEVKDAQDLRYWAGRFSNRNDRLRNEALSSPGFQWVHNDSIRHDRVLTFLQGRCTTRAAEESLAAFVRAWKNGWSGGVQERCAAGFNVVPRHAAPVVAEEPKKKGLMGKVFGRKKSKE